MSVNKDTTSQDTNILSSFKQRLLIVLTKSRSSTWKFVLSTRGQRRLATSFDNAWVAEQQMKQFVLAKTPAIGFWVCHIMFAKIMYRY